MNPNRLVDVVISVSIATTDIVRAATELELP